MADFFRQIRGYRPEIKLFLLFNLLANVGLGVFVLIFNLYLTALGLREDDIGVLSAAQTLSMAAAAASMGLILNRFGLWRTIVGGTAVFVLSAVALSLSETTVTLLPLTIAFGIGFAYMATVTMPFIIEWTRPDQRQQVSALTFSSAAISTTVGSLVGGFLPNLLPFSEIVQYRLTLILGMLVTAAGFYPLLAMGEARRGKAPVDPGDVRADTAGDRRQVRRDMTVFVAIGGLMAIGAGLVGPFFNVYLATLGASSTAIGLVFAVAGLSSAVVGLTAPAVSRRFGSLWAVVVVRVAAVPFFLLLMLTPVFPVAILAWVARQTSISMAWPIDSTFIAEILPPRSRASVFGLRSAAWNVGFSIASLVGGILIVRYGYHLNFLGLVIFSVISMALFGGYYAQHPRIKSGEITMALSPRARARLERVQQEQAAAALAESPALLPTIDPGQVDDRPREQAGGAKPSPKTIDRRAAPPTVTAAGTSDKERGVDPG
ncbi:MAG: MFS transporter [Chloroflexota bacterium]|nr:MFS transporter [Chloroflexota bacterium]